MVYSSGGSTFAIQHYTILRYLYFSILLLLLHYSLGENIILSTQLHVSDSFSY